MKPYFKSVFLLALTSLFFCLPVSLFLEIQFLIPTLALLCIFNAYIYLFHPYKILKHFSFQHFSPNDPWEITATLNELKADSDFKNISCYKTKMDLPATLCFGSPRGYYIILPEQLLDTFSKEDIKLLLSYYSKSISNGSVLFLTLMSGIIYLIDGFLFLLNYPLRYFQKNKPVNFFMVWILYTLSWLTKPLFLKSDLHFAKTEQEKKRWALFVWKLDSLCRLEKRSFPVFLGSVFLTNPLTNNQWECYISLQPKIRSRVKNLIGSYPP